MAVVIEEKQYMSEEDFEVVKIDVKDYYHYFVNTDLNPKYMEARI